MGASADRRNDRADANDDYGCPHGNASTGGGNDRADANDHNGCPHGGDHLPYDECRLCSTNDNYGRWLRAVTNHFVGQLTMSRLARSFDYEFWRFFSLDRFVFCW